MHTAIKQIESEEAIPQAWRADFPSWRKEFPYTLLIPETRRNAFFKQTKKLISLLEDRLLVLAASRNSVRTFAIPYLEVLYCEQGSVLADSWLKIVTAESAMNLKFNAIDAHLFRPIMARIRPYVGAEAGLRLPDIEKPWFDNLAAENTKYMHYGRSVVRAGDPVVCAAYQPGYVHEFGPFNLPLFKRQTSAQLIVVTEKELITIKEDKSVEDAQEYRYDGIFTYIHRDKILDVQFIPSLDRSDCLMKIHLPNDIQIAIELMLRNRELGSLRNVLERS